MNEALKRRLIERALAVRETAHAPYSGFLVGAAAATASGETFGGCNVENASYGLTVCAERNALAAMVAAGHREPTVMAVASAGGATPCGACRQVLAELAPDCVLLLVDADSGAVEETAVRDLLPRAFGPDAFDEG